MSIIGRMTLDDAISIHAKNGIVKVPWEEFYYKSEETIRQAKAQGLNEIVAYNGSTEKNLEELYAKCFIDKDIELSSPLFGIVMNVEAKYISSLEQEQQRREERNKEYSMQRAKEEKFARDILSGKYNGNYLN